MLCQGYCRCRSNQEYRKHKWLLLAEQRSHLGKLCRVCWGPGRRLCFLQRSPHRRSLRADRSFLRGSVRTECLDHNRRRRFLRHTWCNPWPLVEHVSQKGRENMPLRDRCQHQPRQTDTLHTRCLPVVHTVQLRTLRTLLMRLRQYLLFLPHKECMKLDLW